MTTSKVNAHVVFFVLNTIISTTIFAIAIYDPLFQWICRVVPFLGLDVGASSQHQHWQSVFQLATALALTANAIVALSDGPINSTIKSIEEIHRKLRSQAVRFGNANQEPTGVSEDGSKESVIVININGVPTPDPEIIEKVNKSAGVAAESVRETKRFSASKKYSNRWETATLAIIALVSFGILVYFSLYPAEGMKMFYAIVGVYFAAVPTFAAFSDVIFSVYFIKKKAKPAFDAREISAEAEDVLLENNL